MKAGKVTQNAGKAGAGVFSGIGLSKPAQRALANRGINTLRQLSKFTVEEILELHGIGKTAIPVLKRTLRSAGLSFKKKDVSPVSKKKTGSVDEYLASLPTDAGSTLSIVRKAIISAAPDAEENISYGIPFYRYSGHLAAFAYFRSHCSLVTMSYHVIRKFRDKLKPYKISGTTIQFPHDEPVPSVLVKKIIKTRLEENTLKSAEGKNKKEKTKRQK
ncbi:MAG: DUF1801 domain-containing protein [Ignavibacteria bacterium]|nr:DUF1801 domain-containing protein [Ignavibacteria bacterium]